VWTNWKIVSHVIRFLADDGHSGGTCVVTFLVEGQRAGGVFEEIESISRWVTFIRGVFVEITISLLFYGFLMDIWVSNLEFADEKLAQNVNFWWVIFVFQELLLISFF